MLMKFGRGTLSLRALRLAENVKDFQVHPNLNQRCLHRLVCSIARPQHPTCQLLPQSTVFITKRFRSKAPNVVKDVSVIADNILGKPRTPRRRNKTHERSENSVRTDPSHDSLLHQKSQQKH